MARWLSEAIVGPGQLAVRRWARGDAEQLAAAVAQSLDHLRPWMRWVAAEPMSLEDRGALIEAWERDWLAGGDVVMGVFVDGVVAGGCGLHRRIGPGGVEIGYWTHAGFLRQGIATAVARLLTDAAFTQREIDRVEIHHDRANTASRAVPEKLGFCLVRSVPDAVQAPAEVGVSCEWQMTPERWRRDGR